MIADIFGARWLQLATCNKVNPIVSTLAPEKMQCTDEFEQGRGHTQVDQYRAYTLSLSLRCRTCCIKAQHNVPERKSGGWSRPAVLRLR